jgi:cytochrome c oxidase assembly factor CtaG
VTPSRYFIAAAIVLLLGAIAMPVAIAAYRFAETSRESYATAVGVWGTIVMIVSIAGPIVLTLAGIVAMWTRKADSGPSDHTDALIDEATAWLSDERQMTGRR